MKPSLLRRTAALLGVVALLGLTVVTQLGVAGAQDRQGPKPTIVLVHGAWADATAPGLTPRAGTASLNGSIARATP